MNDIYEVVRKENGTDLHISLISILFNNSFSLTNGKELYDHRAVYPLLSLFSYPLMILLTLYLHQDELNLQRIYEKKYGVNNLEVNILDPLTIISLNLNLKGMSISPFINEIIQSFEGGQMEECLFLLGIDDFNIEDYPLSKKIEVLMDNLCNKCNKEVINLVTTLINTNNKIEALSILLKDVLGFKSKESYNYLINELIDKENNN